MSKNWDKKRTSEYMAWCSMKRRCYNPNTKNYHNYGGRGITVCDEWKNDYIAFLNCIGPKPTQKHSLDRQDNDGNYEPGNVRWSTRKEQGNNRRTCIYLEYKGVKKTIMQWSEELNVSWHTLHSRWAIGQTPEQILTTPVLKRKDLGLEK